MTAKKHQTTASKVASVVSIPGYEIKDLLGRGGMAMVYLAVQQSIDREVALKVLSPDHSDDTFSKRFLREAKIASHLAHPNIITIFDAGIHNDIHYMSMEYIKGKNFNDARDILSRKQKLIIIKEIALALDFAHKKGFVHRDIKPENILLHQDGRAILTDFGIAKKSDISKGLTETGKILGTPYFMSPEQTKGLEIDYRTDIYSLGVVLFQALAGYVPYDGPSLVSICIKHLSDPIPKLPKGLEIFQPIINTCMSKKPEHRYKHASEIHAALNNISNEQLTKIDAAASDFKHSPITANAKTMVESAINESEPLQKASTSHAVSNNIPSRGYIKTKQSNFITSSDDFKKLKRRKRNILVLLLILLLSAGYYKQNTLKKLWFDLGAPLAKEHLPLEVKKYLVLEKLSNKKQSKEVIPVVKSAIDIENEKIQSLLKSLDKIPSNATLLATIYQQRLTSSPNNVELLSSIQSLKDWYFERIKKLTLSKNYITARKTMTAMLNLYPELDQNKKYNQLLSQLDLDEKNEPFLQKSKVYFAVNALNKPEGANSLEQLMIVMHNDPNNKEAISGLNKIAEHFKAQAQNEYSKKQYFKALNSVNSAIQAISDDPQSLSLQHNIKKSINNTQDLKIILDNAKKLVSSGYSINSNPKGDSAYDLYQGILSRDQKNKAAINGLKRIQSNIIKTLTRAIKQNRFQDSNAILGKALKLFPESLQLKKLQAQLQAEMNAVLPIVPRIKISSIPFKEINQTNLQKIKIGQLLYIGFEYHNFTQESTPLIVKLFNGNNSKLVLQKSLSITGKNGNHYFTIQLPNKGITSGDYSIELLLGKSRLIKANLFGIH